MGVDQEARGIFDRMALDFQQMVKRPDVDCIFARQPGNDRTFFYSEAPGYFPGQVNSGNMGTVSLVGYRINSQYQLERLGKGLTWAGAATGGEPGSPLFLAWNRGGALNTMSQPNFDRNSLLDQNWASTIGTPPAYVGTDDSCYSVLGPQTFRLEICYLLRDGTLSTIPVLSVPPPQWSGATFYTSGSFNTTAASGYDVGHGFAPGSRWYDSDAGRAYICLSAAGGAAVWSEAGVHDITAFVVTLGLLDAQSRKTLTNGGGGINLASLVNALGDPAQGALQPTALPAAVWNVALHGANFAQQSGLPRASAARVYVYQRLFYVGYARTDSSHS
jgi:hypothetical protein